ncbi:MAG TPA: hypothetical protein VER04_07375 [Polyangiaceae bacterium]|nr:hypothetical protein [Polyangiaceae bacterium]
MLKVSVWGSLALVPLLVVGCGSDGATDGAGGASSAGTNSGGTGGARAGAGGASGASAGKGGDNSVGGEETGGTADDGGAAGEQASGGGNAGTGGSAAGHGGTSGGGAVAGGGAGGSAGHGTAGTSGAGGGGVAGGGGTAGGGGAAGGHAGTGGGSACTTSAQCVGSQVCVTNVCTACDGVGFSSGNTVYFVDPVNGSDANGTGSGRSGGHDLTACAFKTITRALQVIGSPTQASGAVVKLKGNLGAASGEAFPISVPQYVVIQGASGPVTVTLAAGKVGFNFAGTGSTLKDLVLEGGGTSDVGVRLPTADVTATLDAVTVQNTAATAVDVLAGTLTLLAGTTIQGAGTTQVRQEGITVEGTGKLIAKITTGRVSVIKNTAQGIRVLERGSVTLEGAVTSNTGVTPTTYAGTIVISQNNDANIELNQTGSTPRPLNTLKGILATGSVTSDGLLILGGTVASVRRSVFVGNGSSGVHLSHTGSKANGVNDMTAVDLGKAADPGLNVVQGANDQLNNKGAGICINLDPAQVQAISAQGNIFAAADCSTTAATLTKNVGACGPVTTKPGDLGWEWLSNTSTSKVTVDAAKCN